MARAAEAMRQRIAGTAEQEKSDERINLRLTASAKATLERAAALAGLSLTDYILTHTLETAREDLARAVRRCLSERDTEALLALIESEGKESTERVQEAVTHYNRVVGGAEEP
jgi:uncharacterized protein (DUF1778 family)